MYKLKVAIVGVEHTHCGNMYDAFSAYADKFDIIGCADLPADEQGETEEISLRLARNMSRAVKNGIKVYEDYHELLALRPDLVIICSNMCRYPSIVDEVLSLNLNTVIEKPMAMTFEDGIRMYNSYKNSRALFAINWPVAWAENFIACKNAADSGEIGDVLRVHYRSPATLGPYACTADGITAEELEKYKKMFWYNHNMGGGSSLDYGGYGCTLSTWIFGRQAERVSGIRKNFFLKFSDVEDYVNYTLDFGEGVADIEGSWSTINNGQIPSGPVIYGSKGIIVTDRYSDEAKIYKSYSHFFTEPDRVIKTAPWDKPVYTLPLNLYDNLTKGAQLNSMITPEFNIKALAALDAGIRSSYSGKWEATKKTEE